MAANSIFLEYLRCREYGGIRSLRVNTNFVDLFFSLLKFSKARESLQNSLRLVTLLVPSLVVDRSIYGMKRLMNQSNCPSVLAEYNGSGRKWAFLLFPPWRGEMCCGQQIAWTSQVLFAGGKSGFEKWIPRESPWHRWTFSRKVPLYGCHRTRKHA